ncbi:MAG: GuaB3 family IMP dehydrogenase-related protein [Elusimicrobiota bacterium]|jgi:IMP dehydrogenase|nr:GuaB3 family IMP dehydrogenase-related protein [Elusimicrobiota bacterium]
MGVFIGINKEVRRAYGFDEIALSPSDFTVNPDEVDTSWQFEGFNIKYPIMAAAMDGVVDVKFAIEMSRLGGLAVLNLDGVQTRYDKPDQILGKLISASQEKSTELIQNLYKEPVKLELIVKRIKEIKKNNLLTVVSVVPRKALEYGKVAKKAGADILVIQSTVTAVKHYSTQYKPVNFKEIIDTLKMPIIIGNCINYQAALDLMEVGASGILVGVGPGAACTSRGVLGIGVPQVTATIDCAAARDYFLKKTGKYVSIITDGGMDSGGDICKAFASGADAVMVGSLFARAKEAPGKGYHWGMATVDKNLPRGTRVKVGVNATLKQILLGPSNMDDGSQNLIGALKTSMGSLGAKNIKEMQMVEMVIAPSIKSEGKLLQKSQKIGMGKK